MGFRQALKERRERIKREQAENRRKREQRKHRIFKEQFDREFEKGKQTVVINLAFKGDLERCLESAKEHGYKMTHKDSSLVMGMVTELIFEKL